MNGSIGAPVMRTIGAVIQLGYLDTKAIADTLRALLRALVGRVVAELTFLYWRCGILCVAMSLLLPRPS